MSSWTKRFRGERVVVRDDKPVRWLGEIFKVVATGRIGVCIGVSRPHAVDGGNTQSRRQPNRNKRPTTKKLWLRFPDGIESYYNKYEVRRLTDKMIQVMKDAYTTLPVTNTVEKYVSQALGYERLGLDTLPPFPKAAAACKELADLRWVFAVAALAKGAI